MSQAHIEQFYAKASGDQALLAKMLANTQGPDDFVANAVKEGKTLGYTFTTEEASAWIKKQQEIKKSGELSDSQLEAVAGGKGGAQAAGKAIDNFFTNPIMPGTNQANPFSAAGWQSAGKQIGGTIGSWFSSW